jgi:uncharacterized protein
MNRNLMFKRRVGVFAVLFAATIGLFDSHANLAAQEKSFLWQVRSPQNTVHVLGSIHFLKKESYPLKTIIEETFNTSKKLILEIDLRSASPDKVRQLTLQKGVSPDALPLDQRVSKDTYTIVSKRAAEAGIDVRALHPFKPWVVAMTLASLKLQKLGFDPSYGIDRYLAGRAEQTDKPIEGLETAEFQIDLFDRLSPRQQELFLRQTLLEIDQLEKSTDKIVQAWRSGDSKAVETLILKGMHEYPEVKKVIIDDRNRRWLPHIEKLLAQADKALVVVGAAHLVGKDGVIELLKDRGYTVEQQ